MHKVLSSSLALRKALLRALQRALFFHKMICPFFLFSFSFLEVFFLLPFLSCEGHFSLVVFFKVCFQFIFSRFFVFFSNALLSNPFFS